VVFAAPCCPPERRSFERQNSDLFGGRTEVCRSWRRDEFVPGKLVPTLGPAGISRDLFYVWAATNRRHQRRHVECFVFYLRGTTTDP